MANAATCRAALETLRRLLDEDACDLTALREAIVTPTVEAGRYPLGWA